MTSIHFQKSCCLLLLMSIFSNVVQGEIFTSIQKMKELFFHEKQLLSGIKRALKDIAVTTETQGISTFCQERPEQMKHEKFRQSVVDIKHPNGVYSMIKHFVKTYKNVRSSIEKINNIPYLQSVLKDIPSSLDLRGARKSLLRLQEVYNLDPVDMTEGNYSGFHGPPLDVLDTYNLGLVALEEQHFSQSIQWLKITRASLLANHSIKDPSMETVVSLLHQSQATENKKSTRHGSKEVKLSSLLRALNTNRSHGYVKDVLDAEMKKVHNLCAEMDKKYLKTGPKSICTYRPMLLPYYRMAEEILSTAPYVSLIYNITMTKESNAIQRLASRQLYRAEVQDVQGSDQSEYRTSHVAFLGESDSKHLASVTRRIGYLTNLECFSNPDGYRHRQSAGEKYQIVNYGIGGHYSVHLDTYETSYPDSQDILKNSGNRIATVLIYLSHVDRGGSTVFPWLDMAIPPLQHSALMWYNVDTAGVIDFRTRHAGCPVLVGEKWVMNKWILSHANTFKRPCGLTQTANQQRNEKILTKG